MCKKYRKLACLLIVLSFSVKFLHGMQYLAYQQQGGRKKTLKQKGHFYLLSQMQKKMNQSSEVSHLNIESAKMILHTLKMQMLREGRVPTRSFRNSYSDQETSNFFQNFEQLFSSIENLQVNSFKTGVDGIVGQVLQMSNQVPSEDRIILHKILIELLGEKVDSLVPGPWFFQKKSFISFVFNLFKVLSGGASTVGLFTGIAGYGKYIIIGCLALFVLFWFIQTIIVPKWFPRANTRNEMRDHLKRSLKQIKKSLPKSKNKKPKIVVQKEKVPPVVYQCREEYGSFEPQVEKVFFSEKGNEAFAFDCRNLADTMYDEPEDLKLDEI